MNDREYIKRYNLSYKQRFIRWIRSILLIVSPCGIYQGDPQDCRILSKLWRK